MVTRVPRTCLLILLVSLLLLSACSPDISVQIGDFENERVPEVSAAAIKLRFFNYVNSTIISELSFFAERTGSPREGFLLIETRQDFGTIWVLVNEEKYSDKIRSLKRNKKFKVCGQVTAITRGEEEKTEIAFLVP